MKVYTLGVLTATPRPSVLAISHDLYSFGYFQRSSVKEFLEFFAKTIGERTARGQRQSVEEQGTYIGHVYRRMDDLIGVVVTDMEYPTRAAYSVINKVLDDFYREVPRSSYAQGEKVEWIKLSEMLVKYQDAKEADTMLRVQQELDETKIVLHKTIESVLQRGEKLDTLVERSDTLSGQTKLFYKTAKKTNSCCVVM